MGNRASLYRIPPMSGLIKALTLLIVLLPLLFTYLGLRYHNTALLVSALFICVLISGVWLWMRPSYFVADNSGLTIVWPLRKLHIPRHTILRVRVLERTGVKEELGWALRIGIGGLFGGFGLLWTRKHGLVRFYITRLEPFVLIEQRNDRPLLITVANPHDLLKVLETGDV